MRGRHHRYIIEANAVHAQSTLPSCCGKNRGTFLRPPVGVAAMLLWSALPLIAARQNNSYTEVDSVQFT